jgi:hypothetical protein
MPLNRDRGPPHDALVGHAHGRRGRLLSKRGVAYLCGLPCRVATRYGTSFGKPSGASCEVWGVASYDSEARHPPCLAAMPSTVPVW